jgi:catechol 2,3-dioxygenase-like lactoylglutathione lyase family enzyme
MLATSDLIAFVPTTDLARARSFYESVLGLRLDSEGPFACVFDANGVMLRVTPVNEVARVPYTVLGWRVADIGATVRDLTDRGVGFVRYEGMEQDEIGIWATPGGDRVAWFRDPDGNTLSLTQFVEAAAR